jgi:hypothetical protein
MPDTRLIPDEATVNAIAAHLMTDRDGHCHLDNLDPVQQLEIRQVALNVALVACPHMSVTVLRWAAENCNDVAIELYLAELIERIERGEV